MAIQRNDSRAAFAMAPVERANFCVLRNSDWRSALVMSFEMPAITGVNQAAATTLFGAFFLVALGKAVWHIRRKEVALHREWMIRAFAVVLAVATIRPIIGIFFATRGISGLSPREFFGTAFWIGFTVQLMAAEAWIRSTAVERKMEIVKAGVQS